MNISGQEFIQAMSAIGAGIAMIAGVGPGIDRVLQPDTVLQQLDVIQEQSQQSLQQCFLDRPLPRQQVFTVSPLLLS